MIRSVILWWVLFITCAMAADQPPKIDPKDVPAWRLTVSEPQLLVVIAEDGTVTIHGDVHSKAFWERVAAAFKEDCPAPSTVGQHLWLTPASDSVLTPGTLLLPNN